MYIVLIFTLNPGPNGQQHSLWIDNYFYFHTAAFYEIPSGYYIKVDQQFGENGFTPKIFRYGDIGNRPLRLCHRKGGPCFFDKHEWHSLRFVKTVEKEDAVLLTGRNNFYFEGGKGSE